MYAKTVLGVSKQRALAALTVVTLLSCAAFLFLSNVVKQKAAEEATAIERLRNDSAVLERYTVRSVVAATVSADPVEARANEFLMAALGSNGISDRSIDYDQPVDLADGRQTLKINVQLNKARLASVLGFMREVEKERRNLVVLSAQIERENASQDVWNAHLVYGAVITPAAKSRT
jgi:hypothetical protein